MKIKIPKLPLYIALHVFFSCTDIYLFKGIKFTYLFAIPLGVRCFRLRGILGKKETLLLLWYFSFFLAIPHVISTYDYLMIVIGQLVLFVIYFSISGMKKAKLLVSIDLMFQYSLYILVIIGFIQLVLYYLIGSSWGVSHVSHGVGLPRTSSLCAEPDWFGVICMMAFIHMLFNIIYKKKVLSKRANILILLLSGIMLVLNLTRAAWVATIGSLIIFLFISRKKLESRTKRRFIMLIMLLLFAAILLMIVLYFTNNTIFSKLITRLDTKKWISSDGGAADSRISAIKVMFYYFKQHPFTGNGVGGMGEISSNENLLHSLGYAYTINAGRGGANILITNLFDVGIIGTLFLIGFIFLTLIEGFATYKKNRNYVVLVYVIILIGLLIDFQFNNGFRQAYVWLIMGLLNAFSRVDIGKLQC